jgi:PBP1b-binding outer membrane lipoprotein LpoB
MKNKLAITALILALFLTSCVQKTYRKTVVFTLDASKIKNIKKVGIRGNDKPLSWDYDTEMKALRKDSVYEITTTFETGYQFTEVKFVVNDSIELQEEDNRRVVFSEKDTTYFNAKFNKRN